MGSDKRTKVRDEETARKGTETQLINQNQMEK